MITQSLNWYFENWLKPAGHTWTNRGGAVCAMLIFFFVYPRWECSHKPWRKNQTTKNKRTSYLLHHHCRRSTANTEWNGSCYEIAPDLPQYSILISFVRPRQPVCHPRGHQRRRRRTTGSDELLPGTWTQARRFMIYLFIIQFGPVVTKSEKAGGLGRREWQNCRFCIHLEGDWASHLQ